MTTPRISLHIEKLLVDGLADLDQDKLQSSVQTELGRLLADGGLSATLTSQPRINAGAIDTRGAGAERIGRRVARAAYAAVGGGQ